MKIILTSSGLTSEKLKRKFIKLIDKPINQNKFLLMFGVRNNEELKYVNESEQELIRLGINKNNITRVNFAKEVDLSKLNNFNAIYFCGGNTFYILDRIRKTKLDSLIKDFINKEGLYVGVSAGSIILGPSIEIAGWGSEGDSNDVKLIDLSGLNLTKMSIFPHYKPSLKKEIKEFKRKISYKVKVLKDGQGILIK